MAPKGKEKRKEAKRQKWKPLDAETKQPTQETEPVDCGGDASSATESKSSSVASATHAPIEPTCDPQFRKRGLTSNWGRYDEPVEVETEYNRKRGEDFDLLLSASAGASAHFRFKEQQDWQDEPAELSEFLSIDCDAIVDALQTIPLHERLGLPEDIFPANVIQEFKDEAAACAERYEAFLRTGKRQAKKTPDVGGVVEELSASGHNSGSQVEAQAKRRRRLGGIAQPLPQVPSVRRFVAEGQEERRRREKPRVFALAHG
ncbi:hypothetical protein MTO96_049342 [Rhipicephalus appendiculatus]